MFSDFFEAYHFLQHHQIFENHHKLCDFDAAVKILVVKVNPETKEKDDDDALNTETNVWLEAGPYLKTAAGGHYQHDIELDSGGQTFEEAIIELANLVQKHYGENQSKQEEITEEDLHTLKSKLGL